MSGVDVVDGQPQHDQDMCLLLSLKTCNCSDAVLKTPECRATI